MAHDNNRLTGVNANEVALMCVEWFGVKLNFDNRGNLLWWELGPVGGGGGRGRLKVRALLFFARERSVDGVFPPRGRSTLIYTLKAGRDW